MNLWGMCGWWYGENVPSSAAVGSAWCPALTNEVGERKCSVESSALVFSLLQGSICRSGAVNTPPQHRPNTTAATHRRVLEAQSSSPKH